MNPADPRFTAYADGALSPRESMRFERELASDPEARSELEDIRALQRGLREAFVGGPFEERLRPMREAPRARRFHFPGWVSPLLVVACIAAIAGVIYIPDVGKVRETERRAENGAAPRRIGEACQTFARGHDGRLPVAPDVWDFARQLAQGGGLNDGGVWLAETESAAPENWGISTVLAEDGKSLDPTFGRVRLSFAVLLSGLPSDAAKTTPIAWTRGLRADGTWAPNSPYGGDGGYVVFLGGNVAFFRRIDTGFSRYDGKGMTSNILEALPPGVRVGDATGPLPAKRGG